MLEADSREGELDEGLLMRAAGLSKRVQLVASRRRWMLVASVADLYRRLRRSCRAEA